MNKKSSIGDNLFNLNKTMVMPPTLSSLKTNDLYLPDNLELPKMSPPTPSKNLCAFEMVGFDSAHKIFTAQEKDITKMYRDISSYTLK
jgi:hypothetical protein